MNTDEKELLLLLLMVTFGCNKSPKLSGSAVGDGSDRAASDVSMQVVAVVGALGEVGSGCLAVGSEKWEKLIFQNDPFLQCKFINRMSILTASTPFGIPS